MAHNYAREKRRFDAEWKRKELWYRKEGMSEDNIEEMRRFDLEQFNRDRAYESRRRPLETACGSCYTLMPEFNSGRGGWIEELSDTRLSAKLRELPEADLEFLTLLCVDGLLQAQAARVLGCTQQAVSKRLRKSKNIWPEVVKNAFLLPI